MDNNKNQLSEGIVHFSDYSVIPSKDQCDLLVNKEKFKTRKEEVCGITLQSYNYTSGSYETFKKENFRLNMRGITFDLRGRLLCLPFPKFFSIGQNESTTDLDLSEPQFISDKLDGSLLSFFKIAPPWNYVEQVGEFPWFHNQIRVRTQNSCDSKQCWSAATFLRSRQDIVQFLDVLISDNLTPTFEYIGPDNTIQVKYDYSDLVFLGARCMETGRIFPPIRNVFPHKIPSTIRIPQSFTEQISYDDHMDDCNVEGVVITLKNGQLVKLKTFSYKDDDPSSPDSLLTKYHSDELFSTNPRKRRKTSGTEKKPSEDQPTESDEQKTTNPKEPAASKCEESDALQQQRNTADDWIVSTGESGKTYYYNQVTHQYTSERPEVLVKRDADK